MWCWATRFTSDITRCCCWTATSEAAKTSARGRRPAAALCCSQTTTYLNPWVYDCLQDMDVLLRDHFCANTTGFNFEDFCHLAF